LSLLVAGDHDEAKKQVLELGQAIGFDAVDTGPLANARYLEALGFLNIQLGYGATKYGANIGFKLVGKLAK
jgi:predicted dinucleotide-binding enzyme